MFASNQRRCDLSAAGDGQTLEDGSDSVDLLEVLHFNDATTRLVEVPCLAKQSGFKQQVERLRWVHPIL
jgi:hypothetical protein